MSMKNALRNYLIKENLCDLHIRLPNVKGDTFSISSNYWNEHDWMGNEVSQGYTFDEAWENFKEDLEATPKELRQKNMYKASEVLKDG